MLARISVRAISRCVTLRPVRLASTVTVFTKEHEYAQINGKIATCGITDFAQTQLGDVVYVSLPKKGEIFKKGSAMASVESVKAASDVYAPVSGTVIDVNALLADTPGLVNESAESKAWFVKLEMSAPAEAAAMLQPTAYKALCDAEKH